MTVRTIAQSAVSAVSIYMRQVYMWMTAGLAITAVTAFAVASSPDLQMAILGNMVIMIALIVAQFGMVIALGAAIHKMSATTATAVFIAYSALTGLTLSSIFVVYPIGSIANAFLTATGTFLAMSVYGTVTKRDLTGMGNFLMMGLFGIIIASIVNIFLASSMMDFVISCIGVLIFTGLTAYDTQKLCGRRHGHAPRCPAGRPGTVSGLHQPVPDAAASVRRQPRLAGKAFTRPPSPPAHEGKEGRSRALYWRESCSSGRGAGWMAACGAATPMI